MNLELLNAETEMPIGMQPMYSSLEEWRAEFAMMLEAHDRTETLIAQLFTKMTSHQAEQARDEIKDIAGRMNKVMSERMNKSNVVRMAPRMKPVVAALLGLTMRKYCTQSPVTQEQHAMLRDTGFQEELLCVEPKRQEANK
jgi:hypothetical protein